MFLKCSKEHQVNKKNSCHMHKSVLDANKFLRTGSKASFYGHYSAQQDIIQNTPCQRNGGDRGDRQG